MPATQSHSQSYRKLTMQQRLKLEDAHAAGNTYYECRYRVAPGDLDVHVSDLVPFSVVTYNPADYEALYAAAQDIWESDRISTAYADCS